jgi:hypothetical protein
VCLWSAGGARSRDSSSCVWGVSLYTYTVLLCVWRDALCKALRVSSSRKVTNFNNWKSRYGQVHCAAFFLRLHTSSRSLAG